MSIWPTPESRRECAAAQDQRDPFADDVLERLIASNHNYQREHGHYIVPLAERLLEARAMARLGAHYENALTRIANHDLNVDYADVELRSIARRALKESHG